MTRGRVVGVAVLAAVVLVNVVLLGANVARDRSHRRDTSVPTKPEAQRTPGAPTAVLLGDGFAAASTAASTAGGTAGTSSSYPVIAGRLLGWRMRVVARPGLGYVGPGTCGSRLAVSDLVASAAAARPDVVVLAAGTEDVRRGCPARSAAAAAADTLDELRLRVPRATPVVLGPFPVQTGTTERAGAIRDGLRGAAEQRHVRFLDPIAEHWVTGRTDVPASGNAAAVVATGGRLTPAGAAEFGLRLAADLGTLKLPSR